MSQCIPWYGIIKPQCVTWAKLTCTKSCQNTKVMDQRYVEYTPRNMHTVFALLCFVVVIHWLIFPYPSGLLLWHCGNLTIAPVPAKQPWWIWINTSCEFIMNDYITTTKQSTTKPCAYFLGYTVYCQETRQYMLVVDNFTYVTLVVLCGSSDDGSLRAGMCKSENNKQDIKIWVDYWNSSFMRLVKAKLLDTDMTVKPKWHLQMY